MFIRSDNNEKIALTYQKRIKDKKQFYITPSLYNNHFKAEYQDDIYFAVPASVWKVLLSNKSNERFFFDLCDYLYL